MKISLLVCTLVMTAATAWAETPRVGATYAWPPMRTWLDGEADSDDAAGRVVVHWFCANTDPCRTDLARIMALRQNGKVFVIAYIDGGKSHARRLNPLGPTGDDVDGGGVAYGRDARALARRLGFGKGPGAIVVDHTGNVQLVAGGAAEQLDARDRKVTELAQAISEYTLQPMGPASVKPDQAFDLTLDIALSPWLLWDTTNNLSLAFSGASNVACQPLDKKDVVRTGALLRAQVHCKVKNVGAYEIKADVRFGYKQMSGIPGLGVGQAAWTFNVVP